MIKQSNGLINRQVGLTMIELMIAMVIGLLLTAAVLQVFVGTRVTYAAQSSLAKLQESGRFAMEYLAHDIRQAGYAGCSVNNTITNVVDDGTGVDEFFDIRDAVTARNNVAAGLAYDGRNVSPGSDVIMVKYAIPGSTCTVGAHNADTGTITCQAGHVFQRGNILILSSCALEHSAVFQQTNDNLNDGSTTTISHIVDNTLTPGNCTRGLARTTTCDGGSGEPLQFNVGDAILQMASYRFFIATNDFNEPALWREEIASVDVGGNVSLQTNARELVEGVEDMQILYGVDTNNDDRPDKYVDGTTATADIDDVIAIRISLLVQSNEEGVVQGSQTVRFNGADRAFNDGRLRKVFTSTIALRNRM